MSQTPRNSDSPRDSETPPNLETHTEPTATDRERTQRGGIRFAVEIALAVGFGVFFAFDAWEAVGNLVGVGQLASALGTTVSGLGWFLLVLAVLAPLGLFAAAFALGRRRSLGLQAGFYLVALATSAVLYLDALLLLGPGALLS